ncbi:g760 [Coccomyxa viridis]|uniref:G760 protein n=1 Tax=Coccomyxa viridis TaxID=1274662 RepID=A0ABP1FGH6_9CHLO
MSSANGTSVQHTAQVSAVNGTARSAARVATPRVKTQPEAARPVPTAPLTAVVHDAVRRWFQEAHKEAQRGDVKQQALLGQMLMEGYGCERDAAAGKEWSDKARRRGYRMAGVYCEL